MWMNTIQKTKSNAMFTRITDEADPRSQPYYKWQRFATRTQSDIPGIRSVSFYGRDNLNRPRDMSLTTEDIDGAKPRSRSFKTRRNTNPLNPEYTLPSFKIPPIVESPSRLGGIPTNYIADIEKSRPRVLSHDSKKDSMNISDIEYTEPNYYRRKLRPLPRNGSDVLNVKDINGISGSKKPTRQTDPLNPIYDWGNGLGAGPIEGSKPRIIQKNCIPPQSLIERSTPQKYIGAVPYSIHNKPIENRPLPTGSRVNTLKRGIVSNRITNPMNPNYRGLEGNMDTLSDILRKCRVN